MISTVLWLASQMFAGKQFDIIYLMVGFPIAAAVIATVQLVSTFIAAALGRDRMRQALYAFLISTIFCALGLIRGPIFDIQLGRQTELMWAGLVIVPWLPWLAYFSWLLLTDRKARAIPAK